MNINFIQDWHWPQWLVLIFLSWQFIMIAKHHGEPIDFSSLQKAEAKNNGFVALAFFLIMLFILIEGGFFK